MIYDLESSISKGKVTLHCKCIPIKIILTIKTSPNFLQLDFPPFITDNSFLLLRSPLNTITKKDV
jgi:hypothetical protein